MEDTLLCIDEVADLLGGVRPRFVRRFVAERRIAFRKIGRYVRFEREAVEHFIESALRVTQWPSLVEFPKHCFAFV